MRSWALPLLKINPRQDTPAFPEPASTASPVFRRSVENHRRERLGDLRPIAAVAFAEPLRLDQHGEDRGIDIDRDRRGTVAQAAAIAALSCGSSPAAIRARRALKQCLPRAFADR